MTFTETSTTQEKCISVLKEAGWKYVEPDDLQREYSDVLLEPNMVEALKKLNPEIMQHPEYADEVITKLRMVINYSGSVGLVSANELFTQWICNNKSMPFGPGGEHVPLRLIDFDNISNNEFIVSKEVVYPYAEQGKRFDIVLFINGIPVAVGETKTPARPAISWMDGASDINDYEKSVASKFFVPTVLSFATEGRFLRYGTVGMPCVMWGPWFHGMEHIEGTMKDMGNSLKSLFDKATFLDILRNFILFATNKSHRRIKIIARYQQYEGANAIVDRVLRGYPKKGLIWHFQGSGKSYLMVMAAQKLRNHPQLKNPTVLVVVDRTNLDSQISSTFAASDVPNTAGTETIQDLNDYLKNDTRKIIITTIQKFQDIPENMNARSNIIVMVDEAHRTQEGDLGVKMRAGLPNAFFFGLTGTPINHADKNTFATFGAEEDQDGYMSRYSFEDSIRDGATLPLRFEPVPVTLHIDQTAIDEEFAKMTSELTEDERALLSQRASRMKHLVTSPDRVKDVCAHIANHYKTKVEPNGFKAMVVAYDRECCVLYKNELDKHLPAEYSTIVMHTGSKSDEYKEWRLDKDQENKIIERFNDPHDPLKIVIVTSKLLTGFDAPILQTMYLDKPLKEHTLLQAICRTNRVMPPHKTFGLIVDYLGLFEKVPGAFDYGKQPIGDIIKNISELESALPEWMDKCLSYFPGLDRKDPSFEAFEAAFECIRDLEVRDKFAADYRVLNRLWEALSPNPVLVKYTSDYKWLSAVYNNAKPPSGIGKMLWYQFGQKTIELIHDHVVAEVTGELESFVLDENTIRNALENPEKEAKKIEILLIARFRKHGDNPAFVALGERLEKLRELHELGQIASLDFLKSLLDLAKETVEEEKKVETMDEQTMAKNALTELFNEIKTPETPIIIEKIVNEIDETVRQVRFKGWQNTEQGRRIVNKELLRIIQVRYKIKDKDVFNKACEYVAKYYHE